MKGLHPLWVSSIPSHLLSSTPSAPLSMSTSTTGSSASLALLMEPLSSSSTNRMGHSACVDFCGLNKITVKFKTSTRTLLVRGRKGRVEWASGAELVRTAASATKVEHCTLVCPCPHISTRDQGSEVRGNQGRAQQQARGD